MSEHHDTIIVGAGISGLYLAWRLAKTQRDVIVLEARSRPGGRILSRNFDQHGRVDMGPAWIWPALQPRMQALLDRLALPTFKQFTTGNILYETATKTERYAGPSAHSESYRIAGGSQQVIDTLCESLPDGCLRVNTRVNSIRRDSLSVEVMYNNTTLEYRANTIVLALPPRIAQQSMRFLPGLTPDVMDAWRAVPTWMAVHCKMLFLYDTPFWREQGLSGEVFSQVGPLSEIYDGSPVGDEVYALTAFVGLTAAQRQQLGPQGLTEASLAQLQGLFGQRSQQPLEIMIMDWSQEPETTTELDLTGPFHHPYYPDTLPRTFWENRLLLAGTEVAQQHAGYLEGALESADRIVSLLDPAPRP